MKSILEKIRTKEIVGRVVEKVPFQIVKHLKVFPQLKDYRYQYGIQDEKTGEICYISTAPWYLSKNKAGSIEEGETIKAVINRKFSLYDIFNSLIDEGRFFNQYLVNYEKIQKKSS